MFQKLGYKVNSSYKGFTKYIRWQRTAIKLDYDRLENATFCFLKEDIEKYMELRKAILLDNAFIGSLTEVDKIALDTLSKNDKLSGFGYWVINNIYEKWKNVFFGDVSNDGKINKKELGILLSKIRKSNSVIKKDLAENLGVEIKTVYRVEKGETIPSLEYIYKFSKLFSWKIDDILSKSVY